MVDPIAASRVAHRALFVALALAILFLRLLPLDMVPSRIPGPDLILCLTFVWIRRRPDYVPAALIVCVFLLEDFLTMRPPGPWPLIVLMGTEFLRSREVTLRDLPFALDWAMIGGLVMAMTLIHWVMLAIFIVPQAEFGPTILRALATIAAYPMVVLFTLFVIGLRRAAKGEVDALGHRL
ncbi:hypothetical protein DEA8626_03367 [Defluviimonas aquaemixtae]|uniref:Rod shape-determining protein MreD n=1 Tax=Albidovulum aquaemixtae TaxID=1542388 RepID=A0A2R8BLS1_9RHOB|nr:rod shape-determining protein MreD [Defluviimonas aquaemixtae]SPH24316.1 hypothetical protein DEA8626_03367 [Defluviimonas aquaemixtae]